MYKIKYLLPSFFLVVVISSISPEKLQFTQDLGLSFAVGDLGTSGELALIGPPSHRGGRHIGAVYYWLVTFSELVGQGDPFWTLKILIGINIICLTPLFFRRSSPFILGVSVLLFSSAFLWTIRDPWHSHFVIGTGILTVHFALRSLKDTRSLPWFLFFGSATVLTHFTAVPLVVGLATGIAVCLLTKRTVPKISELNILPIIATALLWVPSLLGFLLQRENFKTHVSRETFSPSYNDVFSLIISLFSRFSFINPPWPVTFRGVGILPLSIWIGSFFLILISSALYSEENRKNLTVLLFPFAFYFISLFFIHPPLHLYFILGLVPVIAFLWGLAFEEIFRMLATLWGKPSFFHLPAVLILISAVTISTIQFLSAIPILINKPIPRYLSLEAAILLTDAIKRDADGSDFEIIARGHARTADDGYRALLGRSFYSKMLTADRFVELPTLKNKQRGPSKLAYLVVCPQPNPSWKHRMWKKLRFVWEVDKAIEIKHSPAISECKSYRLKRKEKHRI